MINFVGNQHRFKDKSYKLIQEEQRWCENHPRSVWGKRSDGKWFAQCAEGFRNQEKCKVGK